MFTECEAMLPMQSVWPSGGDLATASEPTTPPAPVRLSTTTGWPSSSDIFGATRRVMMSVEVPAPKGTTTRTGRFGKAAAPAVGWAAARRSRPRRGRAAEQQRPGQGATRQLCSGHGLYSSRGGHLRGHEYPAASHRTIENVRSEP